MFDVQTLDTLNNVVDTGNDIVHLQLLSLGTQYLATGVYGYVGLLCHRRELGLRGVANRTNGTYTISYTLPTQSGVYDYTLGVNGVGFPANPYSFTLTPGVTVAGQSTAAGAGLLSAEIAVVSTFTVTARDQYGNARGVSGNDFCTSEFKSQGVTTPSQVQDNGDGTWTVTYTPGSGGLYTLSVFLDGNGIKDSPWVISVNSKCPPGRYAVESTGPCEVCPPQTYSDSVNVASCTTCPATTTVLAAGSNSLLNCTCQPGFYTLGGVGGVTCQACPVGGKCQGGLNFPAAQAGFEASSSPDVFIACPVPDSCLGEGQCARGYTGKLCAKCADGFFQISDRCYECASSQSGLVVFGFIVAAFLFVFLLVWLNSRERSFYGFAAFVIGFNSLQIIGLYGSLTLCCYCVHHLVLLLCFREYYA